MTEIGHFPTNFAVSLHIDTARLLYQIQGCKSMRTIGDHYGISLKQRKKIGPEIKELLLSYDLKARYIKGCRNIVCNIR